MAKEIKDIKHFVELTRRADVKSATIKVSNRVKNGKVTKVTKFKVRGTKQLYTLVVEDAAKAEKLQQSLPPSLEVTTL